MTIKTLFAATAIAVAAGAASAATLTVGGTHNLFDASGDQIGWNFDQDFADGTPGATYTFTFVNNLPSSDTTALSLSTTKQLGDFANFAGGVTFTFGTDTQTVGQGLPSFNLMSAVVAAGDTVNLNVTFGDVSAQYGLTTNLDFSVAANVPVPAGAVLLLTALGGVAATRKRKAA